MVQLSFSINLMKCVVLLVLINVILIKNINKQHASKSSYQKLKRLQTRKKTTTEKKCAGVYKTRKMIIIIYINILAGLENRFFGLFDVI